MKIIFDYREKDIATICEKIIEKENLSANITTYTERLDIGDIIIRDDDNKELLIIERKSIKDLMSSVKDGRYKEQSLRLNSCELHNHNIIYLIEGDIRNFKSNSRINQKALYSSLLSLNIYKGFSVMRTFDLEETANLIIHFCEKMKSAWPRRRVVARLLRMNFQVVVVVPANGALRGCRPPLRLPRG